MNDFGFLKNLNEWLRASTWTNLAKGRAFHLSIGFAMVLWIIIKYSSIVIPRVTRISWSFNKYVNYISDPNWTKFFNLDEMITCQAPQHEDTLKAHLQEVFCYEILSSSQRFLSGKKLGRTTGSCDIKTIVDSKFC